jgi:aspartate/methionine/tyrosine aminotransferase
VGKPANRHRYRWKKPDGERFAAHFCRCSSFALIAHSSPSLPATRYDFLRLWKDAPGTTYRDSTGLIATHRLIAVHLPLLEQMALTDFMAEGYFARHVRRMRQLYKERRNALVDALTRELGTRLDITVPEAGMHLVVWLPSGMSAQAAAQRAARYGLHMLPISQFSLRSLQRDGLVLGFASASPQELRAGVHTLALALQAH